MDRERVQSLGTQAEGSDNYHAHVSGPRTYADVKEFLQTDPTVRVMRSGIEGIFGGLWILLILTVSLAFKEVLRIWIFGFRDEKEKRSLRYFAETKNRVTVTIFCLIIYLISGLLLFTPEGKRIVSNGIVIFLFGATVYMVFFYKSKKPHLTFASEEEMAAASQSGKPQAKSAAQSRVSERPVERPAPDTLDASESPEDTLKARRAALETADRQQDGSKPKSKKSGKK